MKKGDRVKLNGKYGITDEKVYLVTSEPWTLEDGRELVNLNGKNGGWLVDGLEVVNDEIDD